MPYLRLYARDLPIQQKRVIAEKLIDITLRTFKLRASQRYQTSVQFITMSPESGADDQQMVIPRGVDFTLEVIGHDLTEEKKRAFAREAVAMLAPMALKRLGPRIVRLLGLKVKSHYQIAVQFNELSPAVSDAFVVHAQTWAA